MERVDKLLNIENLLVELSNLSKEAEIDLGIDYHKAHNRIIINLSKEANKNKNTTNGN